MEKIKDLIERYRIKAKIFLDENIKAFIITSNSNWNYCDILFVSDNSIYIQHFAGKRIMQKERIFYTDIIKFEEYKEKEDGR